MNADVPVSLTISPKKAKGIWGIWRFFLVFFFLCWSVCFIWRSSFVLKDGKRYFHLFDDALISMQYAWNLAHGNGLTWNTLAPPVEGFSNPTMVFWMAFLIRLVPEKSWACFWVQWSGVFFVLYTAWASYWLTGYLLRRQKVDWEWQPAFTFFAFFLTLSSYPFVYYAIMGMETGLHAALFMFFLRQCLQQQKSLNFSWSIPLSGAAIALIRPDAVITLLPIFAGYLWQKRQAKWSILLGEIGLFSLFWIGYFIFRLMYFGEWVPNTAFLKLGIPWDVRLRQGWEYTWITLKRELGGPLFFLVMGLLFWKKGGYCRGLVLLLVVQLGYQTWAGGDAFFLQRFIAPFIGLYFALLATAVGILTLKWQEKKSNKFYRQAPFIAWGLCFLLFFGAYFGRIKHYEQVFFPFDPTRIKKNWEEEILYRHLVNLKFALALRDAKQSSQATIAITWAGVTYYADMNGVDFFGKCDAYIAKLPPHLTRKGFAIPGHSKYDLVWTISFYQPDIIYDAGIFAPELQKIFQQDPGLRNRYEFYGIFYLKKGTPHFQIEKLQKTLFAY